MINGDLHVAPVFLAHAVIDARKWRACVGREALRAAVVSRVAHDLAIVGEVDRCDLALAAMARGEAQAGRVRVKHAHRTSGVACSDGARVARRR